MEFFCWCPDAATLIKNRSEWDYRALARAMVFYCVLNFTAKSHATCTLRRKEKSPGKTNGSQGLTWDLFFVVETHSS